MTTKAPVEHKLSPAAMKAMAEDARQRLEAQRPRHWLLDAGFRSVQLLTESGAGMLAGAIAFRFFMFLVPAVFVLVMGLGVGADLADASVEDVAKQAGIAGVAAQAISSGAHASSTAQWVTLGIAVFALLAGARNLLKALWVSHALLWKVGVRRINRATVGTFALIGILALVLFVLRVVNGLQSVSFAGWLVGLVLFTAVPAALWFWASLRVFPRAPDATWRDLWLGAVVFGVGVELLQLATVLWLSRSIESKSTTYGAIGAALSLLLWAYLLGRLVTTVIALNAAVWRSNRRKASVGDQGG
jgi:uncharacterized BrkB/YihY/UPF0761 family membrane protein